MICIFSLSSFCGANLQYDGNHSASFMAYVPNIKIKLHVFGDRLCRTGICILICSIVGNDGLLFLLI